MLSIANENRSERFFESPDPQGEPGLWQDRVESFMDESFLKPTRHLLPDRLQHRWL